MEGILSIALTSAFLLAIGARAQLQWQVEQQWKETFASAPLAVAVTKANATEGEFPLVVVAVGDDLVVMFDDQEPEANHCNLQNGANFIAVSVSNDDEQVVAVDEGNHASAWRLPMPDDDRVIDSKENIAVALFSSTNGQLYTIDINGQVKLDGQLKFAVNRVNKDGFSSLSSDDHYWALPTGNSITIIDTTTVPWSAHEIAPIGHISTTATMISPDDSLLAIVSLFGDLRVLRNWQDPLQHQVRQVAFFETIYWISNICWLSDDLLVGVTLSGSIHLWSILQGNEVWSDNTAYTHAYDVACLSDTVSFITVGGGVDRNAAIKWKIVEADKDAIVTQLPTRRVFTPNTGTNVPKASASTIICPHYTLMLLLSIIIIVALFE